VLCMVGVIMGSPLRMPPTRSHLCLSASSTAPDSVVSSSFFSLGALCSPFSLLSFGRACPVLVTCILRLYLLSFLMNDKAPAYFQKKILFPFGLDLVDPDRCF
jgi:hypothetical protein